MTTYDHLARFYDLAFAPFERRFLGRWRRETLSLLPANAVILELGAGTGANFEFYPPNKHAVSSELSIEMLSAASKKVRSNVLVQSDAQQLPFPDDTFDAAFATLVFCSIPDPALAFAELRRIIKSGGSVVLLEHVRPPGILGYFFDALSVLTVAFIDDHFNRRTADIAAGSGLEVLEVRRKAAGAVNLIVCRVR
ncbi:class I SAM-dependent methyltransferase [soil metagenome]